MGAYDDKSTLHKIYLIDFGLATPYLLPNGEHIPFGPKDFQGNLAFSSKNAFNETTLSRRDDLISLFYMLIYLATGKIPFVSKTIALDNQVGRIKRLKNKMSALAVCMLCDTEYLTKFGENIFALEFNEKPDYNYLRFLLTKNLLDKN